MLPVGRCRLQTPSLVTPRRPNWKSKGATRCRRFETPQGEADDAMTRELGQARGTFFFLFRVAVRRTRAWLASSSSALVKSVPRLVMSSSTRA